MDVLLVTKSDPYRRFQRHCLARIGTVKVTEAENVVDAMSAVMQRSFDLILTDWLPGQGGLTLLKEIRQYDSEVHVVIVTENAAAENILAAWDAGCADYILLPTDPAEFCERVQESLSCPVEAEPAG